MNPMTKKQLAALISVAAKYGNVATVQALLDVIQETEHSVCPWAIALLRVAYLSLASAALPEPVLFDGVICKKIPAVLASYGEGYHFPLFNAAEGKNSAARVVIMKKLLEASRCMLVYLLDIHDTTAGCFGDFLVVWFVPAPPGQGSGQPNDQRGLFLSLESC